MCVYLLYDEKQFEIADLSQNVLQQACWAGELLNEGSSVFFILMMVLSYEIAGYICCKQMQLQGLIFTAGNAFYQVLC